MKTVVTRHQSLVDYLIEQGIVSQEEGFEVITHATPEDVKGKDVIGVLPLSLACLANTITEVPLKLTPEDRGKELTLARVKEIAGDPVTYEVKKV